MDDLDRFAEEQMNDPEFRQEYITLLKAENARLTARVKVLEEALVEEKAVGFWMWDRICRESNYPKSYWPDVPEASKEEYRVRARQRLAERK